MNQAGGIVANAGTLKVGVGIGGGTYNLTGGQVTVARVESSVLRAIRSIWVAVPSPPPPTGRRPRP